MKDRNKRAHRNLTDMFQHCLSSRALFMFFGKNFPFLFLFMCYLYFGTFIFHVVSNIYTNYMFLLLIDKEFCECQN